MFRRIAVVSSVAFTGYAVNAHYSRRSTSSDILDRKSSKLPSSTDFPEKSSLSSIYSRLNKERNEIRVLELLPAGKSQDIHCNLKIISLDDKPTYTALSYTWGDPIRLSGSPWSLRGIFQYL
jgi:hypothetical protein